MHADKSSPSVEKEYVMGLEKGLAIIEAFGMSRGPLTLTEAAEITGHTKAAVRRSLLTLCMLGYAVQSGRQFRLAPRSLRLGHAYVASDPLTKVAQPILEMTELPLLVQKRGVRMAILTVPPAVAQEVTNTLVHCGITGILNFAPIVLHVPEEVMVNNVNLASELENLSYFIQD